MKLTIYRGVDETAPWETKEVTFSGFVGAKAILFWDYLNGSFDFWLNAGKGHIGGQGVSTPSWFMKTKDLATLKAMRETEKRGEKKSKKTVAA